MYNSTKPQSSWEVFLVEPQLPFRGGFRIFFRRGCTCLLLYFNTNKPHSFFFCRIPVVLENRRSSRGGGGVRTPCTLPLDPPLPFECLGVLWMEVESVFWVAEKMSLSLNRGYSGGQKCCHLFSDISKTSDLFPPTPNKDEFWANGCNDCFFWPQHCWGEWRDDGMNPKKIKKINRSRVLHNNHLEGLFHTVPDSLIFVLHCRCPFNRGNK